MMANGSKVCHMAKVALPGLQERPIRETCIMAEFTEKELRHGLMVNFMKVILRRTKSQDMVGCSSD